MPSPFLTYSDPDLQKDPVFSAKASKQVRRAVFRSEKDATIFTTVLPISQYRLLKIRWNYSTTNIFFCQERRAEISPKIPIGEGAFFSDFAQ
ncbi:MAG: hypothetical protein IJV00_09140, partial [Clostridia bacterium]|nr:hypothetical protein [Clostridia bacterium]